MSKPQRTISPAACRRIINRAMDSHIDLVRSTIDQQADRIVETAGRIIDAFSAGGKVVLFGNGGSAADAQHIAGELVGRFKAERRALPALALTVDTSVMTSISNDYGFDRVFARQVEALVRAGDVVIALSTSGRSTNVIEALRAARNRGAFTVALTGCGGGELAAEANVAIVVPGQDTPRIQEMHIMIGHILCEIVDTSMGDAPGGNA